MKLILLYLFNGVPSFPTPSSFWAGLSRLLNTLKSFRAAQGERGIGWWASGFRESKQFINLLHTYFQAPRRTLPPQSIDMMYCQYPHRLKAGQKRTASPRPQSSPHQQLQEIRTSSWRSNLELRELQEVLFFRTFLGATSHSKSGIQDRSLRARHVLTNLQLDSWEHL